MPYWTRRKALGLILLVLIVACSSAPFKELASLPGSLRLCEGREHEIRAGIPFVRVRSGNDRVLVVRDTERQTGSNVSLVPMSMGHANLEFSLFGVIPLRRMEIDVVPPIKVFPGGHSIGVLIHAQGVLVTGLAPVTGLTGTTTYPARDAGVEVGDMVLEVCGVKVNGDAHIAILVDQCGANGADVPMLIRKKDGREVRVSVHPVLCRDSQRYRIGMWVRDSAAGVGTLTFYNDRGVFGALGHVITDDETDRPIDVRDGRIVKATVTGIEEGKKGQPGEKIGVFLEEKDVMGEIRSNSRFGITGSLYTIPVNPFFDNPVPIGLASEVHEGPAEIITVVQGQRLERFAIEIQKIIRQARPDSKGMVIRVVDPSLLGRTGGIVQGMSGSPIMQEGKLVGAITHVFVNDPTRGYGVFIEWMIADAGLQLDEGEVGRTDSGPVHLQGQGGRKKLPSLEG
ncbi:MAG: SpoIVB peptidase [Bacillota bacterium]